MSELHSIPLTCKEGVYSVFDFYQDADGEDAIFFDYDTQYQMLTYDIPVGQDWRGMTLYSVPEKDIFRTLRACYGEDGGLLKITAVLNGHETLLYIRYEDEEDARKKSGDLQSETQTPSLSRSSNVRMLWQGFSLIITLIRKQSIIMR